MQYWSSGGKIKSIKTCPGIDGQSTEKQLN